MNFNERYYTRNRTLVDVTKVETVVDGQEWVKWRGREVIKHVAQQPFEYDAEGTFYYDDMGKCLLSFGCPGDNSRWDLMEGQNPQEVR